MTYELLPKEDGLWLHVVASSGKQALINLTAAPVGTIVPRVLHEVWQELRASPPVVTQEGE